MVCLRRVRAVVAATPYNGRMLKQLPDLRKPKNEIYTLLMFAISALGLIAQWVADSDVTTLDGLLAAGIAAGALVGRLRTYGSETVADIIEQR